MSWSLTERFVGTQFFSYSVNLQNYFLGRCIISYKPTQAQCLQSPLLNQSFHWKPTYLVLVVLLNQIFKIWILSTPSPFIPWKLKSIKFIFSWPRRRQPKPLSVLGFNLAKCWSQRIPTDLSEWKLWGLEQTTWYCQYS